MKLTTKRNRWYFRRELFQYMIPIILIVGTIDVFHNFMICPLHPEWSAPCNVNWILAVIYGSFLVFVIVFAIISSKMLKKIRKKIENEFLQADKQAEDFDKKNIKAKENLEYKNNEALPPEIKIKRKSKPKKIIVDGDSSLKSKVRAKKSTK